MTLDRLAMEEALPGYELGEEIGRGSFGIVYRARHRALGRDVAVKQLPRAFAADPRARERFVREAKLVAALDHPNIVPVHDFVERDGLCLLVMDFLAGGSLVDRDQFSIDEACAIGIAVASGLGHAHARGIVHRDVKPDNVLFTESGIAKLTDFGIAWIVEAQGRLTMTGHVVGTPAFMAPEQVTGGEIGPPVDVYAWAIVVYEMLAGRLPYGPVTTMAAQIYQHVNEQPAPLAEVAPHVPEALAAVVMTALSKDPADRPADGAQLAEGLVAATTGASPTVRRDKAVTVIKAPATSAPPSAAPSGQRRRKVSLVVAGGLALVLAIVASIVLLSGGGNGSDPEDKVRAACSARGIPAERCTCTIDRLRSTFEAADFAAVAELLESGARPPQRFRALFDECELS